MAKQKYFRKSVGVIQCHLTAAAPQDMGRPSRQLKSPTPGQGGGPSSHLGPTLAQSTKSPRKVIGLPAGSSLEPCVIIQNEVRKLFLAPSERRWESDQKGLLLRAHQAFLSQLLLGCWPGQRETLLLWVPCSWLSLFSLIQIEKGV